jgi:hypothetical protein
MSDLISAVSPVAEAVVTESELQSAQSGCKRPAPTDEPEAAPDPKRAKVTETISSDVVVMCEHAGSGCEWVGAPSALAQHALLCPFTPGHFCDACEWEGCLVHLLEHVESVHAPKERGWNGEAVFRFTRHQLNTRTRLRATHLVSTAPGKIAVVSLIFTPSRRPEMVRMAVTSTPLFGSELVGDYQPVTCNVTFTGVDGSFTLSNCNTFVIADELAMDQLADGSRERISIPAHRLPVARLAKISADFTSNIQANITFNIVKK